MSIAEPTCLNKRVAYIAISACAIAATLGFILSEEGNNAFPLVFKLTPSQKNLSGAESNEKLFGHIFDCQLLENKNLKDNCCCIRVWHIDPYWSRSSLLILMLNENSRVQFMSYSGIPGEGKWLQYSSAQISSKQLTALNKALNEARFFTSADKADRCSMGGGEWMIEGKKNGSVLRWSLSEKHPEVKALCQNIYHIFGQDTETLRPQPAIQ